MLMEALFSRGGYPIHHRINGFNYVFRRNDDGDYVCSVLSGEHRQMMVRSGNFRMYVPKTPAPKVEDAPMIATAPRGVAAPEPVTEQGATAAVEAVEHEKPKRKGGRRKKV